MLATRPEYQGRGLARELIKWGTDQADQEFKFCVLKTNPDVRSHTLL
jgi:hypothetical protein